MTTRKTPFNKSTTHPSTSDETTVVSQSSDIKSLATMVVQPEALSPVVVYLTNQQVRTRYQIGNSTLYRWINDEQTSFPKPHQLGPRCVRWLESELEVWESQRI